MSGTRSHSRTEPATDQGDGALIIVAHGDRGGLKANWLAREVADRTVRLQRFAEIEVGLLRGTPALETVSARLTSSHLHVYPLFMSDGYYVRDAIPERLGLGPDGRDRRGRKVRIMDPIGIRPPAARAVAGLARATAQGSGWPPGDATLLLVAHGSTKDSFSRDAALAIAALVKLEGEFRAVETAYLEEPPLLDDQLRALPGPLAVLGLFIGEGMHGIDDLRAAADRCRRADIALADPLARWPGFVAAVCDDLRAGLGAKPTI